MIHLHPSDSLRITTSSAEVVDVVVSYSDQVGLTVTRFRAAASIAAATTTVLMTVPVVSSVREGLVRTVRTIHSIIVTNADASAAQTITLDIDDGANVYRLVEFGLDAGKSYMLADNSTFLGAAPSSGGGSATDLTYTAATRVLASSTGTDATLPLMSSSNAGLVPGSGGGTANFLRADGTFAAPTKTGVLRTLYVNAGAMIPRTTNGAEAATTELATSDIMQDSMNFDSSTEEGVGFWVAFPTTWNTGTVTAKVHWTAASGSGTAKWDVAGRCLIDDAAMDASLGTEQTTGADTLLATGDMHISGTTPAITLGGTPTANHPCYFQITRDVAGDTLSADAKLLGVTLEYTESSTEPSAQ